MTTPLSGRSAFPRFASFSRTLRAAMMAGTCLSHPILSSS